MSFRERLKTVTAYLGGRETSGRVYRLVVEVTNACNLRCSMCPRNTMKRNVEHMELDIFEKIIADNCRHLEFVSLSGFGEPLLHPNIFKCFEICRSYGVKSGISTNCTQLDESMAQRLLVHPPDQIILALDAVTRESYRKVRVGGDFDAVLENVTRFLRLRKDRNGPPFVSIQCIYMTETRDQIQNFYRYFKDYQYDAIRIRQLTYSGRERNDAEYRNRFKACYWLWGEPMILSNGTVVPCCQDLDEKLALGNIRESSLSALWEEGRIRNLRKTHATGRRSEIPFCAACNMYQPSPVLALGSAFFPTGRLNRMIPRIESTISTLRYKP